MFYWVITLKLLCSAKGLIFWGGGESVPVLRFLLVEGELANFWLVGGGCQIPNSQVPISHDSLYIL